MPFEDPDRADPHLAVLCQRSRHVVFGVEVVVEHAYRIVKRDAVLAHARRGLTGSQSNPPGGGGAQSMLEYYRTAVPPSRATTPFGRLIPAPVRGTPRALGTFMRFASYSPGSIRCGPCGIAPAPPGLRGSERASQDLGRVFTGAVLSTHVR